VFSDNQESWVSVFETGNVSFASCEFTDNRGEGIFNVHDTTVSVSNSTFSGNFMDMPIAPSPNVEFTDCVISDDDVMTDSRFVRICEKGSLQQVIDAIKGGANVNARDKNEWTALLMAVNDNSAEVMEALIRAGADINASNDGWTPLIRAAALNKSPEVTNMLLQAGSDINAKNIYGKTALDYALENKNGKIAELLTGAASVEAAAGMTIKDFLP
jgi:hypothetical protein